MEVSYSFLHSKDTNEVVFLRPDIAPQVLPSANSSKATQGYLQWSSASTNGPVATGPGFHYVGLGGGSLSKGGRWCRTHFLSGHRVQISRVATAFTDMCVPLGTLPRLLRMASHLSQVCPDQQLPLPKGTGLALL